MITKPDRDILKIDLNNLEIECAEHSQLAFLWGEELALAKKKLGEAENALKLAYAQTERDVRENPCEYSVLKLTEDSIKSAVITSRVYQLAQRAVVDAQYEESVLFSFVMALNARKESLSDLTKLHGQQYWSKPTVSQETQRTMRSEQMARTADDKPFKRKPRPAVDE